jgi:hypothetical protein
MKNVLIYFSAGCLGALVNSVSLWLIGRYGISAHFGVSMAPALTPNWLYPRIVWGGIWGLCFILPFLESKLLLKGTVLSLLPTMFQLFFIFPFKAHKGVAGIELGLYTPIFVLVLNWVWGFTAALIIKFAR